VGDEAHAAVSRRPPIPLDTIAARSEGYTYAVNVCASSLAQALAVAPVPMPHATHEFESRA
jgi:hypothetical protein